MNINIEDIFEDLFKNSNKEKILIKEVETWVNRISNKLSFNEAIKINNLLNLLEDLIENKHSTNKCTEKTIDEIIRDSITFYDKNMVQPKLQQLKDEFDSKLDSITNTISLKFEEKNSIDYDDFLNVFHEVLTNTLKNLKEEKYE